MDLVLVPVGQRLYTARSNLIDYERHLEGYDYVVFNVTTSDKEDVRKWMSDNGVDVMDIVPLSKDVSDVHMFKVKVYDKDTVLSIDFWTKCVGC